MGYKGLLLQGVLAMLVASPVFSALPPEIADPHYNRSLVLDPNDGKIRASVGGEFAAFVVSDEGKKAGGGEFRIFPYARIQGDITREIGPSDIIGFGFEVIEPASSLVEIEDDRANRIRARGFLYEPQWPTIKGYWRHIGESDLWELDIGRDRFLGYDTLLFGEDQYQGSLPVLLRQTGYWDNGISLCHERYSDSGERKLYGITVAMLDSEGWVGMEDSWFANSYFRFGAQGEIHAFNLLGFPESLGDLAFLASWTNAEGGSSAGGKSIGAKESFEHLVYGAQYSHKLWDLDFTTRFLCGDLLRGKNDKHNHEETSGWTWETLLGGIKLDKSRLDIYASLSDAQYNGGDKYWVWKGQGTYQKQFMAGAQIREVFGVKGLSFLAAYFQNDMDGEKSWVTLGGDQGVVFGFKYMF